MVEQRDPARAPQGFEVTLVAVHRPPPVLGAHTTEVLAGSGTQGAWRQNAVDSEGQGRQNAVDIGRRIRQKAGDSERRARRRQARVRHP